MPSVYVARHGESAWNREGRYQGWQESPLTELGRQQALALACALAERPIARVIASPLARSAETARVVAEPHRLVAAFDTRLREISHGAWEGRLRTEIERDDGARLRQWRESPMQVTFPGGESLADVVERWRVFARAFEPPGETVLVTHDVIVRVAILLALRGTFDTFWQVPVVNGGYAHFDVSSDGWRLLDPCCDRHLSGMIADERAQAR